MTRPSFLTSESGAVTVDWVVLTAATVGLGLATLSTVRGGVSATSDEIDRVLRGDIIQTSFLRNTIEDFSDGIDGWSFTANVGSAQMFWSGEAGSDGKPGYMRFTDTGNGGAAYVGMSTPYVGDQSRMMDGTISFDMQMISGGRAIADNEDRYPILRIEGENGQIMQLKDAYAPETGKWTSFSADVNADAGWTIDGELATQAQMEGILSNVRTSELRIEQAYGGNEIIGLDNVAFSEGSY